MEGDAGTSRLNPSEIDEPSSSEVGTDQTNAEDSTESDAVEESEVVEEGVDDDTEHAAESASAAAPSSLGRVWLVAIAATLVVLAGGIGFGGYRALGFNQDSQATVRGDTAAVEAAKDCVSATQAPDTRAMAAAAQKIIECGTGAFRSQAILYSGLLVEAYQAANAQVQVSDLRAAVVSNNSDGSVDVLVPLRVKVSNSATQNQEAGYRLRVTMLLDEGRYRIAKLDQVSDPDQVAK